jgi:tRNA dimethylallyltransferase
MAPMTLILGVTASGKSTLAFELARRTDAEIISIDSMKVYKRMDIGTAKPSPQKQQQAKYHLIDVVEPSESFSVDKFLTLTHDAIEKIKNARKPIIAVGGTAMYIKALLFGLFESPPSDPAIRNDLKQQIKEKGTAHLHAHLAEIDPKAAQKIHQNDARRIIRALEVYQLTGKPISSLQQQFDAERPLDEWNIIGLCRPKPVESSRINARVKKMMQLGLLDEVKSLLAEDKPLSKQASSAIGYAELIDHLEGKMTLEEAVEKIKINTRRLAKGQRTWFKTFHDVNWLDIEEDHPPEKIIDRAMQLLSP